MDDLVSLLTVHRVGRRNFNDIAPNAIIESSCEKTGKTQEGLFTLQEEFELSATVGVKFFCNSAQYEDALKNAHIVLLNRLHAPVVLLVAEIKMAIFDGDGKKALNLCDSEATIEGIAQKCAQAIRQSAKEIK